jgi:hypothetical protein
VPDQHIDVEPDAIRDGATGNPIITKEQAERVREEWTAAHPPIPGLRWVISFNMFGDVQDRRLEIIPGWEDAFAPSARVKPISAKKHDVVTKASEANRLGALAYQGWFSALPRVVRENSSATWDDVPEPFREPLRQAAVLVWQHGENAGFHQALLRTLPSAQLGAAGELDNLQDFINAMLRLHGDALTVPAVLGEITRRINALRAEADETAKRARRG